MKLKMARQIAVILAFVMIVSLVTACSGSAGAVQAPANAQTSISKSAEASGQTPVSQETAQEEGTEKEPAATGAATEASLEAQVLARLDELERPSLIGALSLKNDADLTPSSNSEAIADDLSNVLYVEQSYLSPAQLDILKQYGFVVTDSGADNEFFREYEMNRYTFFPNFVTVDSMMHMYHIYFAYLLKKIEQEHLSDQLAILSSRMLELSEAQYNDLAGTEWEAAAERNVAFFAVGAQISGSDAVVPDYVADAVNAEVAMIMDASGIEISQLTGAYEDYSQYKPRGYYEGDPLLESYFRTMMWYGRLNFQQKEEDLDRSALLMTLALSDEEALAAWEAIYLITSFFAGSSDDNGYYEYQPLLEVVYGKDITAADLPGKNEEWTLYHNITAMLPPPAINSVPVEDDGTEEKSNELNKGYRFMGQRFSIDAAIFQKLIYDYVGEADDTDKRLLPDFLDIPAAFGSDVALDLLEEKGDTNYKNYSENMAELREVVASADETQWGASLYSSWLNTLRPLLDKKGEGYPEFMQNEAWAKHNLETFAGSYTELKHDTVLYAKQVVAEMGGGPIPEYDDRGYVEPEPEVYARVSALTQKMKDGLNAFGMLSDYDAENLDLFISLADQLMTISEKELKDETLTDEEYELIRTYGGVLEHLWIEAMKEEAGTDTPSARDFPAPLVTDVATDPNGWVLELATGKPRIIYVVAPVDGRLVMASGVVFDFYQFEWPLEDRMTDKQWRQEIGAYMKDDGNYNYQGSENIEPAWWTQEYKQKWTP